MVKQEYSVFISYSSKDEEQAVSIVKNLELKGYRCWLAKRDLYHSGSDFSTVIPQVIPKCQCVVLLLTEHSNISRHVRNELDIAFENQVPIFPMRLDETEGKQLEWFLRSSQWFDAINRSAEELVRAIVSKLENTDIHEPIEIKKKAWIKRKFSVLYIAIALIAALLLYQIFSPNSAPVANVPSWDDLDLSGYGAQDFKPNIHYDLKKARWIMFIDNPSGNPAVSVAYAKYSWDGEIWETSAIDYDVWLEVPASANRIFLKFKDFVGNKLGPFEYPVDFASIADARLKTIGSDDLNYELSFHKTRGWKITMKPHRFRSRDLNLYYSYDGSDWLRSKQIRYLESPDFFQQSNKIQVKFQSADGRFETNSIVITSG